jgi:hypothetical protein
MADRPWGLYDEDDPDCNADDWYHGTMRDIVKAVARSDLACYDGLEYCAACQSDEHDNDRSDWPIVHKPDCWWMAARRITNQEVTP